MNDIALVHISAKIRHLYVHKKVPYAGTGKRPAKGKAHMEVQIRNPFAAG